MDIVKKAIEELRDSYELHQRQWAKRCLDTIQAELEKKDKIIDEMAKYLADIDFDECCAEIPEPCLGCSWEDYEPHINCIKQYFTKKVEGK